MQQGICPRRRSTRPAWYWSRPDNGCLHPPHDLCVLLRTWVWTFDLKGDQQIELLAWLVIPELGGSNLCPMSDQFHMLVVPCVGDDDPSREGQDADLLLFLEAVIFAILVLDGGRNILGGLIQALIAFLGPACLAISRVVLDLAPQALVGSSHVP